MLVRRRVPEDYLDVFRLSAEAFGLPEDNRPAEPSESPPGRDAWLALNDDTVVGSLTGYSFESWWHGAPIPTCGLAAIAIAPEQRGTGLLRPLAQAALNAAAERGEAISTLFPTANGVYRSLGYEIVGSLDSVTVPIHELNAVRQPDTTTTRRADISDMSAVRAIYRAWASSKTGLSHERVRVSQDLTGPRSTQSLPSPWLSTRPETKANRSWASPAGTEVMVTTRPAQPCRSTTSSPSPQTATARCGGCSARSRQSSGPSAFAHPATTLPGSSYRHHRGRYEVASRTCFGSAIRRQHSAQRS